MLDDVEKKIFEAADYLVDKWNENEGYPRIPFKFALEDKKELELLINQIESKLPRDVLFYNIDGKKVFEIKENQFAQPSGIICFITYIKDVEEHKKQIREKYAV